MFNSMQKNGSANKRYASARATDYAMLLLAAGGIAFNVLFLFDDPVMHSYVEHNYEPSVAALHAATTGRDQENFSQRIYVMR